MNRIKKNIYLYGLITILSVSTVGCGRELSSLEESSSSMESSEMLESEESSSLPEENLYKDPTASITIEEKEAILAEYEWLGIVHNTSTLNVRMEPSTRAFIMGKAYENAAVHIIEDVGDWYKIEEHNAIGYVHKDYIATGEEARALAMENMAQRAVINTEVLNIRKGPSTHTNVVGRVYSNSSYRVVEEYDNWTKIQISSGSQGFVHSDYVNIIIGLDTPLISDDYSNLSQIRRNLINLAWSYVGGKYVWGGTTLGVGVDCSGFMLRLYETQGIELLRVARAQATMGRVVSTEEMKPGDLVFYYVDKDYISHVGMYAGNGKLIHAASAERGIRVDNYDYIPVAFVRNLIGD